MADPKPKPAINIRDLSTLGDLQQIEAVEREVWQLAERDVVPLTLTVATKAAGSIWVGAFEGDKLVGFAFGFLGSEHGRLAIHSHMLAVLPAYRHLDLGYRLKVEQRQRAMDLHFGDEKINEITWTFDPLQSRNAHLNFSKLGVVSATYKIDFYGPQTSSVLHQNGTDRLWVTWPIRSRRVHQRLGGKENAGKESRADLLEVLSRLTPLVRFNGEGRPARTDLAAALARQRIAIEIPSDIGSIEQKNTGLAREWRAHTRWAFTETLKAGFFVAEFCRTIRGQQGPGVYLLERGPVAEYVPELS